MSPKTQQPDTYYLQALDTSAAVLEFESHCWGNAIAIDDDDLQFGGKPLSAWYEEDRRMSTGSSASSTSGRSTAGSNNHSSNSGSGSSAASDDGHQSHGEEDGEERRGRERVRRVRGSARHHYHHHENLQK